MSYKRILVTGGSGFIGSNICINLKKYFTSINVIAFDNLIRRGSELNVPRLNKTGVTFIRGDIRNRKNLKDLKFDLLIECSAEPSALAGITSSSEYVIDTNLWGAANCFEQARKNKADVIFLSTSRVYPVVKLNSIKVTETDTRFEIVPKQILPGVSVNGISENFLLDGTRTLYGATKLSAELLLQEYIDMFEMRGAIDRFSVVAGPWQMGKIDQGIVGYWVAAHVYDTQLQYIGYNGSGKQVRDILHVDDLFELLMIQIECIDKHNGKIYNVGGGVNNSVSLRELTDTCAALRGKHVDITPVKQPRQGDVKLYITDNSKIGKACGWKPKQSLAKTVEDTYRWMTDNKVKLAPILAA